MEGVQVQMKDRDQDKRWISYILIYKVISHNDWRVCLIADCQGRAYSHSEVHADGKRERKRRRKQGK